MPVKINKLHYLLRSLFVYNPLKAAIIITAIPTVAFHGIGMHAYAGIKIQSAGFAQKLIYAERLRSYKGLNIKNALITM